MVAINSAVQIDLTGQVCADSIGARFYSGAGVTTTRNDMHVVVTEYGVAWLHGKTVRQRARALIDVAHPRFRDELTCAGRKLGYL